MSISVRQTDSCVGPPSTPGVFFHTYFESVWSYNFNEVVGGDALVMMFVTNEADTRVTSITDVYGNTWTQIPGAQVSEVSSGGTQRSVDVWRADNVAAVRDYVGLAAERTFAERLHRRDFRNASLRRRRELRPDASGNRFVRSDGVEDVRARFDGAGRFMGFL
jgi:hypothetical protein